MDDSADQKRVVTSVLGDEFVFRARRAAHLSRRLTSSHSVVHRHGVHPTGGL